MHKTSEFMYGFKKGIPIGLGYFPVSFTFGITAVKLGLPPWAAVIISLTNFTSAGQFAGTKLIASNASYIEIALTTLVINIRYMLMSLSLSQKILKTSFIKRALMSFGITDEIYAIASLEEMDVSFHYMAGLSLSPYIGWVSGTCAGGWVSQILPESVQSAMGIALYAMFIALVFPYAKKSKTISFVVGLAFLISALFSYAPVLNSISKGFAIIVTTLITCSIAAILFPREEN